ncbi:MAG: LamG domain-containing protein [Fulvivirga sp.]
MFINDSSAFNFEALKSISADVEVSANNVTNSGSISVNITDVFEMTDLTGLVAYYPLNGNVNDLVGGEQGITNGTENSVNQFEIENQALDFINDGSFIDIGNKNFFVGNNNSFSISIWINPRSFTTANGINRAIISKLSQQTSTFGCNEFHQEFLLDLTSTGAVRVIYYEEDGTGNDRPFRWVNSQELIETNEWSHLYISYNGTLNTNNGKDRVRILINGLESSTNIIQLAGDVPQEIVDTDSHLGIGNMLSSNGNVCIEKSFDGLMDEVAFFSRELSSSEIQSILNLN